MALYLDDRHRLVGTAILTIVESQRVVYEQPVS
jgi:hypothetical protein